MEVYAFPYKTIIKDKSGKYRVCGYNEYKDLCIDKNITVSTTLTEMDIPHDEVKQISGGYRYTIILMNDGTLKAIGSNNYGQLGLGDKTNKTQLTDVPNINGVKKVVCGYRHSCLLMEDGTIMVAGYNSHGQLGLGNTTTILSFTKVNDISNVADIITSRYHTILIMKDGTMKGTGYNSYYQIQTSDTSKILSFVDIDGVSNVKKVVCSAYSTLILLEDGTLMGMGNNGYGELGLGSIEKSGLVQLFSDVKDVACTWYSTMVMMKNGNIMVSGYNTYGQLGLGDTKNRTEFVLQDSLKNVSEIICGAYHALVKLKNNDIYGVGYNYYGELAIGLKGDSSTDVNQHNFVKIMDIQKIKIISCGGYNTFMVNNSNELIVCGKNNYGELGLGNTQTQSYYTTVKNIKIKNIKAGIYHTLCLTNDNKLLSVGHNGYGQLGLNLNTSNLTQFTEIEDKQNIEQIECGMYHSMLLMKDKSLFVCGRNIFGQLGIQHITNNINEFTRVENIPTTIKKIVTGYHSSFILLDDGTVMSTGYNEYGQLGLGDNSNNIYSFTKIDGLKDVIDISSGYHHTVVLLKDGTIMVAGRNNYGQLGLNDAIDRPNFTKVPDITGVKKVFAGQYMTAILMNDGTVKSCGYNSNGQLGLGNSTNSIVFNDVLNVCDIKDISLGYRHMLLLDKNNNVYVCGLGSYGETGLGSGKISTPVKLQYLEKNIIKYLLGYNDELFKFNEGELYKIDNIDFTNATDNISDYSEYIKNKSKIIKYFK